MGLAGLYGTDYSYWVFGGPGSVAPPSGLGASAPPSASASPSGLATSASSSGSAPSSSSPSAPASSGSPSSSAPASGSSLACTLPRTLPATESFTDAPPVLPFGSLAAASAAF